MLNDLLSAMLVLFIGYEMFEVFRARKARKRLEGLTESLERALESPAP